MSEWQDEEIVLVSAIEHFSYCPRQYALIHVEHIFDENLFTMRGRRAHERVDEPDAASEDGVIVERALPLWSYRLGLQGKSDVVEFHPDGTVYPVEYKFGPRRDKIHDDLQLCAQALCLEEMLDKKVERGAIYYFSSRRRREVDFTEKLRASVLEAIDEIRKIHAAGVLPPPLNDARCPKCSLIDACMPDAVSAFPSAAVRERIFIPLGEEVSR